MAKYVLQDTNGDGVPDFLDLRSNGTTYDLYLIDRSEVDEYGGGFLSRTSDADNDGVMNPVDTNLVVRGAPGSPYSPHAPA